MAANIVVDMGVTAIKRSVRTRCEEIPCTKSSPIDACRNSTAETYALVAKKSEALL